MVSETTQKSSKDKNTKMTKSNKDISLQTLHKLLTDNQNHEMVNGMENNRNHIVMTLIALYRLGASTEQMEAYYHSKKKKENISFTKDEISINEENWIQFLGNTTALSSYIKFFIGEIKTDGVDKTLQIYLPKLISGVTAAAYHGLLRLVYAIDVQNNLEIALSMAYFAWAFQKGPDAITNGKTSTFTKLLNRPLAKLNIFKIINSRYQIHS